MDAKELLRFATEHFGPGITTKPGPTAEEFGILLDRAQDAGADAVDVADAVLRLAWSLLPRHTLTSDGIRLVTYQHGADDCVKAGRWGEAVCHLRVTVAADRVAVGWKWMADFIKCRNAALRLCGISPPDATAGKR